MKQQFTSLAEALAFVKAHGGPVGDIDVFNLGSYTPAAHAVQLADGATFLVEAYCDGPISEFTPDCEYGVNLYGITS